MASDFQEVLQIFDQLKSHSDRTKPLWDSISKYTGIQVQPDYRWAKDNTQPQDQLDRFVHDPTAAISVNQAGDYLTGVMWGTGEKVVDLQPSPYVLELASTEELADYYSYATKQLLYHMNHPDAGYMASLRPYSYDQIGFGTSGIGTFPNQGFIERSEHNALIFRNYGIDNTVIDVGKSGMIEWVFVIYHWRVSRFISEFAKKNGVVDKAMIAKLPKKIRDSYAKGSFNDEYDVVFGVMPTEDFNPTLKGKKGAKYRGVWFMPEKDDNSDFFKEEQFNEKPIAMARMILVRGEVYGRSSMSMLISSIRSVDFMMETAIEVMEKMADPSLGMFGNAIMGDGVLNTSPSSLTVFNSTFAAGGNPTFPLYDVGDPSALIQFLIPYLNEKIITAAKIDALLDFNSDKTMTATESLQRFTIRGQSLTGMLGQQKNELQIPTIKRSVSILSDMKQLGVNPNLEAERAKNLRERGRAERVIPQAVLDVMESGRPWFDIKFNNDLEKLMRTETVRNLLQVVQAVSVIFPMKPEIVEAIDWYKLLKAINDSLDSNSQIMLTAIEFKDKMVEQAEQKALAAQAEAASIGAGVQKDVASANRADQEGAAFGRE